LTGIAGAHRLEIMNPADPAAVDVQIVDYTPAYAPAFRALNEGWIQTYFTLEATDREMLGDPERFILQRGGAIFVALRTGEPVGVCALAPHGDDVLELAKMAVAPSAQGLGIGEKLARAALERARALGARRVFLESNTRLGPAIALYRKLGFREVPMEASPYQRVDIQMVLVLVPDAAR
jgi:ribosomal protein S18 acetylase RimI-like enzyme